MFPGSVAVKKTALAALKNEWPTAIAASTIPLAFYIAVLNLFSLFEYVFAAPVAIAAVRTLFIFFIIFVGMPLCFGLLRVLWGLANDVPLKIIEVFHYFSSWQNYKRVCSFTVLLLGGIIIKTVLLLLPSYIIDIISNSASSLAGTSMWVGNLWIFAVFLRVLAICFAVYVALRYYLAPFIFVANDGADSFECINKAYAISRVSIGNYVWLTLSLIGWILLSAFFIPMVFTLPYLIMCYLVHSRFSAAFYNEKVRKG